MTVGSQVYFQLLKNGSVITAGVPWTVWVAGTLGPTIGFFDSVQCVQGDILKMNIRNVGTGQTLTIDNNSADEFFAVERVGD